MSVDDRIKLFRQRLPENVKLIAVSKFHPAEAVQEAYNAGQRMFGESRAQEFKAKRLLLPPDIEWHFIGTLQRNKVKDIAAYVHTIHSVDSIKLIEEIEEQAGKYDRVINVLLEIHLAQEEAKHGMSPDECLNILRHIRLMEFPHIKVAGLMCMATYTDDIALIRSEFRCLKRLFDEIKAAFFEEEDYFCELSMGMSDDYLVAIEEGSTMVRIGTGIFGEREY